MQPVPMRMRQRIIELYASGKQTHEISASIGTCKSGTRRIRQRLRERGTLDPLKSKPGPDSGLTPALSTQIHALLSAEPGLTRQQLRNRLGLSVDVRTLGRWLASHRQMAGTPGTGA